MTDERYVRVTTLMAEYALRVDAREAKTWAELWTKDGALAVGSRRVVGHAAIAEFGAASAAGTHLGSPAVVHDGPDGLTARSTFVFVAADGSRIVAGTYVDRLVDDGTSVRFAERVIEMTSSIPLAAANRP